MKKNNLRITLTLYFTLAIVFIVSLLIGRYRIDIASVFDDAATRDQLALVVINIRLPRAIAALFIGTALATAGTVFQTLFRNPMASPATLGASSGAAFGALLAIFLEQSYGVVIAMAFFGGLLSIFVVIGVIRHLNIEPMLGLVLTGMVVSSLFSGLNSLLKLLADPLKTLPEMTYWLFGSLANIGYPELSIVAVVIAMAWLLLYKLSFRINVLSMGYEEAKTLGVDAKMTLYISILAATLLTAASVAISGIIGWIGLVIPHVCRNLVSQDSKWLILAASPMAAIFLLIIDALSRTLYTAEIPVGILISLIGAPVFLWILLRRKRHYDTF